MFENAQCFQKKFSSVNSECFGIYSAFWKFFDDSKLTAPFLSLSVQCVHSRNPILGIFATFAFLLKVGIFRKVKFLNFDSALETF